MIVFLPKYFNEWVILREHFLFRREFVFASTRLLQSSQLRITFKFKVPPAEFQATEYVWISELKLWTCRLQIRKTQERLSSLGSKPTLRRKCTPTVQDFYCGITSYLCLFCLVPLFELPGPRPQRQVMSGDELPGTPATTVLAISEALFSPLCSSLQFVTLSKHPA